MTAFFTVEHVQGMTDQDRTKFFNGVLRRLAAVEKVCSVGPDQELKEFLAKKALPTSDDLNIKLYGETGEMIARITQAVRAADQAFDNVGGNTRHWVRECFIDALKDEGLEIRPIQTEGTP